MELKVNNEGHLDPSGLFDLEHLWNRYENVEVYDPDVPYDVPFYTGPACQAGNYLAPGTYTFKWLYTTYTWEGQD